jgi:hypothetical protein
MDGHTLSVKKELWGNLLLFDGLIHALCQWEF